jgi:hypothetical protein
LVVVLFMGAQVAVRGARILVAFVTRALGVEQILIQLQVAVAVERLLLLVALAEHLLT